MGASGNRKSSGDSNINHRITPDMSREKIRLYARDRRSNISNNAKATYETMVSKIIYERKELEDMYGSDFNTKNFSSIISYNEVPNQKSVTISLLKDMQKELDYRKSLVKAEPKKYKSKRGYGDYDLKVMQNAINGAMKELKDSQNTLRKIRKESKAK